MDVQIEDDSHQTLALAKSNHDLADAIRSLAAAIESSRQMPSASELNALMQTAIEAVKDPIADLLSGSHDQMNRKPQTNVDVFVRPSETKGVRACLSR